MGPGRIHHPLALDLALVRFHAGDPPILHDHLPDGGAGLEGDSQSACLGGVGHCQVRWLQVTVAGTPEHGLYLAKVQQRPLLAGGLRLDELHLQPCLPGDVCHAGEFLHPLLVHCDSQ